MIIKEKLYIIAIHFNDAAQLSARPEQNLSRSSIAPQHLPTCPSVAAYMLYGGARQPSCQ
jgi:hypothetical protein